MFSFTSLDWLRTAAIFPSSLVLLAACADMAPAPVETKDRVSPPAAKRFNSSGATSATAEEHSGWYTVKKGDTLYSIALDHGQDYKDVAAWNAIDNPSVIKVGQRLRVSAEGGAPVAVARPVTSDGPVAVASSVPPPSPVTPVKCEPKGGKLPYSEEALARARQGAAPCIASAPAVKMAEAAPAKLSAVQAEPRAENKDGKTGKEAAPDDVDWMWPAKGKVTTAFAEGSNKGIDIAGKVGDPVVSAGAGVVSYAGSGLRGYGNLVVVRHNATYLSVYAHNSKILVKEKQTVAKGQKIAELGSSDAESPRLHFEIRRMGKPADPQKFLPLN